MIREQLGGKTVKEKADIKGVEIAKVVKKKRYTLDSKTKKWK
jgi:hypothetical protein